MSLHQGRVLATTHLTRDGLRSNLIHPRFVLRWYSLRRTPDSCCYYLNLKSIGVIPRPGSNHHSFQYPLISQRTKSPEWYTCRYCRRSWCRSWAALRKRSPLPRGPSTSEPAKPEDRGVLRAQSPTAVSAPTGPPDLPLSSSPASGLGQRPRHQRAVPAVLGVEGPSSVRPAGPCESGPQGPVQVPSAPPRPPQGPLRVRRRTPFPPRPLAPHSRPGKGPRGGKYQAGAEGHRVAGVGTPRFPAGAGQRASPTGGRRWRS